MLFGTSGDGVNLWELEEDDEDKEGSNSSKKPSTTRGTLKFREVMSLRFTSLQHPGYGVVVGCVTSSGLRIPSHNHSNAQPSRLSDAQQQQTQYNFGGDRNPDHLIFVFDACYCPANGLLGVALSDGSLRLMNGRGVCVLVLQLPGCQSHLTAFGWDITGRRLATCIATGHVILWGLEEQQGEDGRVSSSSSVTARCRAILEGGHELGRPLYGAKFCGRSNEENDDLLLLSWGVDGRLVLWDSYSQGEVKSPLAILKCWNDDKSNNNKIPIYAVDTSSRVVAVGGAVCIDANVGFLGTPVYLYDL